MLEGTCEELLYFISRDKCLVLGGEPKSRICETPKSKSINLLSTETNPYFFNDLTLLIILSQLEVVKKKRVLFTQ